MEIEEPEIDPQDTADLSADMADPEVEQQIVPVYSIYEGLVAIGKTHGKLYRTNGKRADMMRFALSIHSVFSGNTIIINNGELVMPVLETASARVDMTGLPWLTPEEQRLDPNDLYEWHYYSRPNGSERYMSSNFRAKDVDELTDDEIAAGMPRAEARVRLEAWILCASMDGTLEKYVKSQPNWKDGYWWWTRESNKPETGLVIKTDWWRNAKRKDWSLIGHSLYDGSTQIAEIYKIDPVTLRTIKMADRLLKLVKSLSQEAFRLQMRINRYDLDPLICETNRVIDYIETGKDRKN